MQKNNNKKCNRVGSCMTCHEAIAKRDPETQMVNEIQCKKGYE